MQLCPHLEDSWSDGERDMYVYKYSQRYTDTNADTDVTAADSTDRDARWNGTEREMLTSRMPWELPPKAN